MNKMESINSVNDVFLAAMRGVYLWMAAGLGLTAVVAYQTANSETLINLIFSSNWTLFGLFGVQILFVLALVGAIDKLSPSVAGLMFAVYAALNGLTLSVVFLVYSLGTISLTFVVTAVTFLAMSLIGYTTKQDLSSMGGFLMMGLVGLIVASVANIFFASTTLHWIITYAGVLIFIALTAYDTQKIKRMAWNAASRGEVNAAGRLSVLGALMLYLDFVNLFLYLLRLFGGGKD